MQSPARLQGTAPRTRGWDKFSPDKTGDATEEVSETTKPQKSSSVIMGNAFI
jgi:hypothetical protein